MRRNYAREKSETARKARSLGQFIVGQMRQKLSGPPAVPGSTAEVSQHPAPSGKDTGQSRGGREAPVLHACLRRLRRHGIKAWRQNTGTAWIGGRPVSFGFPGAGDITGILPDGRRLEIEVKRPVGGRQSKKQKKFQAMIEENNGVYLLVRSEEELCQTLEPILNCGR